MPVEIVTIVNSSGKIISNGRHLLNVLKEAKASYQEKKAAIKAERAVKRSETFDVPPSPRYYDEVEYGDWPRRASHDDAASQATSRRSYGSKRSKQRSASQTRPALTERNLQTHSEVSSTAPSRPPVTYRSPYAETAGRDMTLSRPTLAHAPTMPIYIDEPSIAPSMHTVTVPRSISDPALREKRKEIDMDLAYGNVPPDLEERIDLDPVHKAAQKERNALDLIGKIEKLLTEAQCLHHTATHIIQHLQGNPDAAAAVALTLAELSALLGKMSPSFLSVLKGGSPAIFALLASPQFLIAAGVTVGVTVVMFGGWKIVKRVSEAEPMAATPMAFPAYQPGPDEAGRHYPESEISAGFDEALVIEEELSSIENWRRGITPFGEDAQADLELISPEADRAMRNQYGGDDTRSVRTTKTSRTTKTNRTSKTAKTSKTHKSRRDSTGDGHTEKGADNASEAGSHRSHRTTQSHRSHRTDRTDRTTKSKRPEKVEIKAIDDGRSDRDNSINVVLRPKKDNMLKSLFKKKKDREEKERVYSVVR
ncbi:uncharacterized protein GGS22DRAFT_154043 [Annulohypoxylon maeteangense]|uniref:uncharacterized protein n=1 Tax=Annulohypoxylon maeteangense TaxID=1927788 RepID=UPI002008B37C|nr:uncharacterized protein GGS22DRAFT_154043 [Annulohypoxylon maeteangense]KAI0887695.1 hypothetical protein GGS22DRAFT_154043 [Annulohypoxylon maeteangense]